MEFCDNCENKMNIKWKNENSQKLLIYYCTIDYFIIFYFI